MAEKDKENKGIRLGTFLASTGQCSRRDAAQLVEEARVRVDGKVVRDLSFQVIPGVHEVSLNNKVVTPLHKQTLIYNKPKGVICHPEGIGNLKSWKTVLPEYAHLKPAGRLDAMSEGLLVLTNDGDLHYRLTHPKFKLPKIYRVWVRGRVDDYALKYLTTGAMVLDGTKVQPCSIEVVGPVGKETQLLWTLKEGRNRQIRRMAELAKLVVVRLVREKVGPLTLKDVPLGGFRPISEKELKTLERALEEAQKEPSSLAPKRVMRTPVDRKSAGKRPGAGRPGGPKPGYKKAGGPSKGKTGPGPRRRNP